MESGQMLMMVQTPAGATNPVTLTPASSSAAESSVREQSGSAFAGILGGISSQDSRKQAVSAGTATTGSKKVIDTSGEAAVQAQNDVKQDIIATILATLGSGDRRTPLGLNETNAKPEEEASKTAQPDALMPQEVALSATGAQITLPIQLNGRMPESAHMVEQHGEKEEHLQGDVGQVAGSVLQAKADSTDGSSVLVQSGVVQSANIPSPATAVDGFTMEAMPKAGTDNAPAGTLLRPVAPDSGTSPSIIRPELAVNEIQKNAQESQPVDRLNLVVVQAAEEAPVVKGPVLTAKPVTGTPYDTPSLQAVRLQEARPVLADDTVSTIIAANSPEQADPSAVVRAAHAPQLLRPNIGVSAQEAGIKRTDSQEDGTKQRPDAGTIKKSLLGDIVDFPKVVASSAAEKEFMNDGEKGASDHLMNGQSSLVATHPQMKTDNGTSPGSVSVAGQSEAARSDVAENVVRQVKEMFANRDMKQGSEQITLKLTPEKLGELTVNLKMENQQLRIEIVAENRSVKDALMQHTETLKDSLSRQNITMESFDVTTSNGQQGFAQGEKGWRQLAQQQLTAWTQPGSSRLAAHEATAEALPRYVTQQQYTMLDVHF